MSAQARFEILRRCVYFRLDPVVETEFTNLVQQPVDWPELIKEAERSAISNLLYRNLKTIESTIPANDISTLKALAARHLRNNRERVKALIEILGKFEENGIQSTLLKGMSLIHTLYEDNSQRPMGDIDILVKRNQANLAQSTLRDIGYSAADRKKGFGFDHHHLPMASKKLNGLPIQVEIHHNALSGDVKDDLRFEQVEADLIPLTIGEYPSNALGHRDQLLHLCHHTFEPCDKIKLGAVADIYNYVSKYKDNLDWDKLKKNDFRIINTLRCLHYLSPLPSEIGNIIGIPKAPAPAQVGKGFSTLSTTLSKHHSFSEKFQKLFKCSEWWLHIFYQIAPEKSLFFTKLFSHPAKIVSWLTRRFTAQIKSKLFK